MTLYIGAVYGGPEDENSLTDKKITYLMQLTRKYGIENRDKASLNVVFHKSGSICKNEFAGIRTAKFSKKKKMLMIQVAIPEIIPQQQLDDFLFVSLRKAAELAKPKFQKANIKFDSENYLVLVGLVEKEYYQNPVK